jgi:hypothetical protein
MITAGLAVDFQGGGHERRPSASPRPTEMSDLSHLVAWGRRQEDSADVLGKCESDLDLAIKD